MQIVTRLATNFEVWPCSYTPYWKFIVRVLNLDLIARYAEGHFLNLNSLTRLITIFPLRVAKMAECQTWWWQSGKFSILNVTLVEQWRAKTVAGRAVVVRLYRRSISIEDFYRNNFLRNNCYPEKWTLAVTTASGGQSWLIFFATINIAHFIISHSR